jgi:hypothetical protein
MWYVHATASPPTFAGVICVNGENRIPPESCPIVGHSLLSAACAAVPAVPCATAIVPPATQTAIATADSFRPFHPFNATLIIQLSKIELSVLQISETTPSFYRSQNFGICKLERLPSIYYLNLNSSAQ